MQQLKSKFYKILLVIYTLISIASTAYLLLRSTDVDLQHQYHETKQEIESIKQYLKIKDSRYEQTIDSLKAKSDSLQTVISITDKRLQHSRKQVTVLSTQLNEYTDQFELDTTLEKNAIAFDSLSMLSKEYRFHSEIRDSLCDAENSLLSQQLQIKDSIIETGDSLLRDYKSSVEQLLYTCDDLNEKLHSTQKKLKRKSLHSRVLSVGVVFISGFLISKFINFH